MRSPLGAAGPGLWKERGGRLQAGALISALTSSSSRTRACVCQALLPATPPPFWAGAERHPLPKQPAFARQPGALGLRLSALSGCYRSCFRKTFPANDQAFPVRVWLGHLAFQQGGQRGSGRWEPRSSHPCNGVSPARRTLVPGPHTGCICPAPRRSRLSDSLSPSPLPLALDPEVPGPLHGRGGKVRRTVLLSQAWR